MPWKEKGSTSAVQEEEALSHELALVSQVQIFSVGGSWTLLLLSLSVCEIKGLHSAENVLSVNECIKYKSDQWNLKLFSNDKKIHVKPTVIIQQPCGNIKKIHDVKPLTKIQICVRRRLTTTVVLIQKLIPLRMTGARSRDMRSIFSSSSASFQRWK